MTSYEGMRYPSVDQLQERASSKYKLVIAVAERAKQIEKDKLVCPGQTVNKKAIGIALEEIYNGKVIVK